MLLTNATNCLHYQPSYNGGAEMVGRKIQVVIMWVVLTVVLSVAVRLFLPIAPLGYDWATYFSSAHNVPAYYPPWTTAILCWLPWPVLIGLTLSTYIVAVMKRARSPMSAACALLAIPLFWCICLGQLDGLVLLGVLGLPWLVPLVLFKPQVAAFAILAKRKYLIVAAIFLLVSLAIWGFWPVDLFTYCQGERSHLDIALGWYGLPLALLVLWLVPGWNEDKLMLAGACIAPHLIPYHLLPLMPAIARLSWPWALAVVVASWVPALTEQWWLVWVSVALLGAGLVRQNE